MRKNIVNGGPALDRIFMSDMLELLYSELERRLSGRLDVGSRGEAADATPLIGAGGLGAQPPAAPPGLPRDGVCTYDLGPSHGRPLEEDQHSACLCQLTTCLSCLSEAARKRKTPVGLLPYELRNSPMAIRWQGRVETQAQARSRACPEAPERVPPEPLPEGVGFQRVQRSPPTSPGSRPQIFPHPQMTDVLAVEEQLRWRLKEMGAVDPAVEARYGASTNAPAALEGLENALKPLEEDSKSEAGKNGRKMTTGRSKARYNKSVKAPPKPKQPAKKVYLPAEWVEMDPNVRNMAVVLTFRHFVKVSALLFSASGRT